MYIGKGENVAKRVQDHPEKLEFDVTSLILFTSKDENLNASQVGWLESHLISAAKGAKRIPIANKNVPTLPALPKAELATVQEFLADLKLIAQTAGFDYFSQPKSILAKSATAPVSEFHLRQKSKSLHAIGYPSDEGFIVKAGSDASATINNGFKGGYPTLREKLIRQEVLIPKAGHPDLLTFAVDYAFSASSAAAAVIAGNNMAGPKVWKTDSNQTLGDFLEQQNPSTAEASQPL
ncbi:MAG: GIY-YIG nuclease family protein [Candidatus Omnitrophica bacterium]|nr:GIY-YIG nuclease family protein [Candidatus Omnitrophota bacterium]